MAVIDYYFYSASPFTYLGHEAIQAVADKHGCELNFKPVDLFAIWAESGAVPPAKRPPVRQRMRLVELQRLALHRDLPINHQPKFFPVDATLADCSILAVLDSGADARSYMASVFKAVWVNELNIADEATLTGLLSDSGHDASAIMEASKNPAIAAKRVQNAQDAIAADSPGVPAYVLIGECFWGQDRVELLDEALTSGRAPFKP
ncbi:MAG: 2-hydroxychromene-2-carboxylate isomerase [Hyphomicrobiales bacterium]